jgi:hypothetical protein
MLQGKEEGDKVFVFTSAWFRRVMTEMTSTAISRLKLASRDPWIVTVRRTSALAHGGWVCASLKAARAVK